MKYNPHDYQRYATEYIESHPEAAVFLDMGLGKTSITLTALNNLLFDYFDVHRILVVAPLRVARNTWSDEIEKWEHLHNLTFAIAVGSEKERLEALKKQADITMINRENLQWLIEKSGQPFEYDMVVIDELSSFKNHQAKRFKALMKVRPKVKRIVGLTGTPSSNGLMDLFAEFKILDMGMRLGRFIGQYRNIYFKALANAEEDAFLNGTGVGQPLGLFAAKGGGTDAVKTTTLKADDIITLIYALKRPYRKNAAFIMNDATVAKIRTLKDNNGAFMWQPSLTEKEPDRLMGYALYTSPYCPADKIAFGDYSYYNIGDRGTRSFKQLTELFAGNGMIGFVAKERVDGKLILPEAVQILTVTTKAGS